MVSRSDPPGVDRRALLQSAVAGTGALLALGGCGSSHDPAAPLSAQAKASDVTILVAALELERRTIAAYAASIPLLGGADVETAKTFLNEEQAHAGELISLIRAAKSKVPDRAASYPIGRPGDRTVLLALLHSLERLQIASYLRWIPRLTPGPTRAAVASILSSDAQHVAVLRAAQGMPALASAFVTGSE